MHHENIPEVNSGHCRICNEGDNRAGQEHVADSSSTSFIWAGT